MGQAVLGKKSSFFLRTFNADGLIRARIVRGVILIGKIDFVDESALEFPQGKI